LLVIHAGIVEVCKILSEGGRVLIHCAAGLHRTGMIANTIFRFMGLSESESLNKILEARKKTFELCGEHRLAVADKFVKLCGTYISQTPKEKLALIVRENGDRVLVVAQQRKGKGRKNADNNVKHVGNTDLKKEEEEEEAEEEGANEEQEEEENN